MTARQFWWAFLWGEYVSTDFRCAEGWYRKTGKGKEILAVRNAASNEYGGINCEVQFEDAVNEKGEQVWLPYTATETDNTEHGKHCGLG